MLYYDFKDYEGFKKRFNIKRDEHGNLVSKNKILLAFVKNKNLFKANEYPPQEYSPINIKSIDDMVLYINTLMSIGYGRYKLNLNGKTYYSDKYATDAMNGIPEDGSIGFIRYVNMERGCKMYKMKAGKMYRHILDTCRYSAIIAAEAKTYMCEILAEKWKAMQHRNVVDVKLCVDRDFQRIYDSTFQTGDFHSCMNDKGFHTFYERVEASAAHLYNKDGMMLARCIIFNEVLDEQTGEYLRLAERQYASDGNQVYMRMLVDKLIEGGYIDGYKTVGAGCCDAFSFVRNDGTPLRDVLSIEANLEAGSTVSYQDSFKWYDADDGRIYNSVAYGAYNLEVTGGVIDGVNWDEYYEEYTFDNLVECQYGTHTICVGENNMGDFVFVDNHYQHENFIFECPECGRLYDIYYNERKSDLTGRYYCCEECKEKAEEEYRKNNQTEAA